VLLSVSNYGQKDSLSHYKNQIKLSPFRFFRASQGVELSYVREYFIQNRIFSTQLSGEYIFGSFSTDYPDNKPYNGFSVALEQKYFYDFYNNDQEYVSFDYRYTYNTFEDLSWFVYKTPPDTLFYSYPDTFLVKKQIHTFNLRVGEQLKRGRFIIDFNVGLGIRYRDVIHLNRINTQDKMLQPRHPNIGYANVVDGKFFMINIPMAIKIGFLF
jgi:hypothetical protein